MAGVPPTGNSMPGATWKKRSSEVSERTTFASNLKRASFHACRSSSLNPQVLAAELPAVRTRLKSVLLDQPSFGGSFGLSCAHASATPVARQAINPIAITLRCGHDIPCPPVSHFRDRPGRRENPHCRKCRRFPVRGRSQWLKHSGNAGVLRNCCRAAEAKGERMAAR